MTLKPTIFHVKCLNQCDNCLVKFVCVLKIEGKKNWNNIYKITGFLACQMKLKLI